MPLEIKKGSELSARYVISDNLGTGAFATVWRATDKEAGRDVAIKRLLKLSDNERTELLSEADKTKRLQGHKNIVEIYGTFEEDGEDFLVMEYVDGSTLDDIIRQHILKNTWFELDEALDYFRQILQGLLTAHSGGVYHRDIKPSNILISKLGIVKLVDFGIAKSMHAPRKKYESKREGAWTGTPEFMSPEQAKGEPIDHLTDIFSAGIVGYILLTGRHPYNHPSGIVAIPDLIKENSFECPPLKMENEKKLPEAISKAIIKMLKKDKNLRPQTVLSVIPDIDSVKQSIQSCSNCGSSNPLSNSYCGECGQSLKQSQTTTSAEQLTNEGFEYTKDNDWEKAIKKYNEAVSSDPKYVRAYANLAFAQNKLGKYSEAIDSSTKGMEHTTVNIILHRLYDARGFAKSNLKDYEGAMADFTKAIDYNERNPRVFYHRAESKALAGRFKEAYQDILSALQVEPEYIAALRLKGKLESQGYVKPI